MYVPCLPENQGLNNPQRLLPSPFPDLVPPRQLSALHSPSFPSTSTVAVEEGPLVIIAPRPPPHCLFNTYDANLVALFASFSSHTIFRFLFPFERIFWSLERHTLLFETNKQLLRPTQ